MLIIETKHDDNVIEITGNITNGKQSIVEIANYYLSKRHLPSRLRELVQQGGILIVSITGGSLYGVPANDYALHHGSLLAGETLRTRQWVYIFATCIPALAVLYNATDTFFTTRHNETIPEVLEEYLVAPTGKVLRKIKDIGFGVGAALSAVPLMMVSFAYPLFTNTGKKILQAIVVEIDNTILHLLPLELAWKNKIYRLPILPFEWICKKIYSHYANIKTIPLNKDAEEIRTQLIDYVRYCKKVLLLKNEWGFFTYHWTLDKEFKMQLNQQNSTDLLQALITQFPKPLVTQAASSWVQWMHSGSGMLAGFLGAGWVVTSWGGYLLSPILQIYAWAKNEVGTGIIIGPALYLLGVLLSNFGYNWLKKLYEFMTQWEKDNPKLPFAFKLYPKFYYTLQIISIYIMFFSYAAAEELVLDSFTKGVFAEMQLTFVWLARTGISFLGVNAIHELSETLLTRFAIHFGGEDSHLAACLMTTLEQFEYALQIAKAEVFVSEGNSQYLKKLGFFSSKSLPGEGTILLVHKPDENWVNWLVKKCCFWSTAPNPEDDDSPRRNQELIINNK